jgi:transposase-like protein
LLRGRARVIDDGSAKPDKRRFLDEAARPGASVSEVARRYGIDRRILCRWKHELSPPAFVAVEIADAALSIERSAS